MTPILAEIHIYPIKSCGGISLQTVEVGPKGPHLDRRWMLVSKEGRFISQREHPSLALVAVRLEKQHLFVNTPNGAEIKIPISNEGPDANVTVWKSDVLAKDQGNEAAQFFSDYLGRTCHLVFFPDQSKRQVDQQYAKNPDDEVGFADGFPFLLISNGSLDTLCQKIGTSLLMNRFRPNLVITNCSPFAEDTWQTIKIGPISFLVAKPCSRCTITTIDQETGLKGVEPLQTLATFRKEDKKILFGQNLVHKNSGFLNVGLPVEVLCQKVRE